MLTEKQIKEFQRAYLLTFDQEISKKEALDKGIKLVRLFQIIIKNLNKKYEN